MTDFNDSAMSQIFSHDVAWMMEQEVRIRGVVQLVEYLGTIPLRRRLIDALTADK